MNPITIEEIEHASSILFNGDRSKFFDDMEHKTGERIDVIQSLGNIDVDACPGSGKTTALLAKLIILANRMPFDDGRGICVLTHTNVAIDLIKDKLGAGASRLFTHPNFFGTIQSFVDRFLAVPALIEKYQIRPNIVDNDKANAQLFDDYFSSRTALNRRIFITLFARFSQFTTTDFSSLLDLSKRDGAEIVKFLKKKNIVESHRSPYHLNYGNSKKSVLEEKLKGHPLLPIIKNTILKIRDSSYRQTVNSSNQKEELNQLKLDFVKSMVTQNDGSYCRFSTSSGKAFLELKEECFKNGLITFSDAYNLASYYLNKHPEINQAFKERFRFIFVDEMQDTAAHQMGIINQLFKNKGDTVVQYYGDPNQAIFESEGQKDGGWNPDPKQATTLTLTNSKRFGQPIADIINPVRIIANEGSIIKGENNGLSIKPCLLLFSKEKDKEKVLLKFGDIITENKLDKIENAQFVAIGRVGKKHDKGELSLNSYFDKYEKVKSQKREFYPFLILYLGNHLNKFKTVKNVSDRLMNGILHALEIHGFKNEVASKDKSELIKRRFTKTTLLSFLRFNHDDIYYEFKEKLIEWSKKVYTETLPFNLETKQQIEKFLEEKILPLKGLKIDTGMNFFQIPEVVTNEIEVAKAGNEDNLQVEPNEFVYKYTSEGTKKELSIKLNTIHGEKGETHTATLLLETYFKKKHDSEQIKNQLFGESFDSEVNGGKEKNMAVKMAYVAMSRPKYLLCFAFQKSIIQDILDMPEQFEMLKKRWTIVEL